jgi:hypothetical protein
LLARLELWDNRAAPCKPPGNPMDRAAPFASPPPRWLFSPALDLSAFLLPPLVSLLFCGVLALLGALDRPLSPALWLLSVVAVDVAHVYATGYRVYADPAELRRRPLLYTAVPLLCFTVGAGLYAISALTFWRAMAYLAVWHFVRQQVGWVALSRRRDASPDRLDRVLDSACVYAGTLYPILYWHAHLPRHIHWFVAGDFAQIVPAWVVPPARLLYLAIGALWLLRQFQRGRPWNRPKLIIMAGTWATWYTGIVALDSDVAFTLTNVLAHGVPYILVVWRYHSRKRAHLTGAAPPGGRAAASLVLFYLPLLLLAVLEEGIWDRLVWHDHGMLFPLAEAHPGPVALIILVPLLSLPQTTHYLLDGWIWRSAENPDLARYLFGPR